MTAETTTRPTPAELAGKTIDCHTHAGVSLLVSDIYKSNDHPQGVFSVLFGGGVSTVCCPVNLHELPAGPITVTALPLKLPGATQLPCRVIAETPCPPIANPLEMP